MEFELKHKVKGNKITVTYSEEEYLIDLIRAVIFSNGITKEQIFGNAAENKEQAK